MTLTLTQFLALELVENTENIRILAHVKDVMPHLLDWEVETLDNNLLSIIDSSFSNERYNFKIFVSIRPMTDVEIRRNRSKIRAILNS